VKSVEHVAAVSHDEPAYSVLRLEHAPFHTAHLPRTQTRASVLSTGVLTPLQPAGCLHKSEGVDGHEGGGGEGKGGGDRVVLHDSWLSDTVVTEGDTIVLVNCYEVEGDGAWHLRRSGRGCVVCVGVCV